MLTKFKFDEIHVKSKSLLVENEHFGEKKKIKNTIDDFISILVECFIDGWFSTGLPKIKPLDIELMYSIIYLKIGEETVEDRLLKYIQNDDLSNLQKLMESEAHRVHETAAFEIAKFNQEEGKTVKKKWHTMNDLKVRDTHDFIDGIEIDLFSKFTTFDLDSAFHPGGFSQAENNVNCRCWLSYKVSE